MPCTTKDSRGALSTPRLGLERHEPSARTARCCHDAFDGLGDDQVGAAAPRLGNLGLVFAGDDLHDRDQHFGQLGVIREHDQVLRQQFTPGGDDPGGVVLHVVALLHQDVEDVPVLLQLGDELLVGTHHFLLPAVDLLELVGREIGWSGFVTDGEQEALAAVLEGIAGRVEGTQVPRSVVAFPAICAAAAFDPQVQQLVERDQHIGFELRGLQWGVVMIDVTDAAEQDVGVWNGLAFVDFLEQGAQAVLGDLQSELAHGAGDVEEDGQRCRSRQGDGVAAFTDVEVGGVERLVQAGGLEEVRRIDCRSECSTG